MKKTYIFTTVLICLILVAIIISPQIYIGAFSLGLQTWAHILLPTIFPLIFFTKLLADFGALSSLSGKMCFTQKLFNTPPISTYAFLVSILSGYPVGAKIVADLYADGYVSRREAIKMCTFTSNSGPMFIYGSVGISMLCSRTLGLIMLVSHILSAVLNGVLFRGYVPKIPATESCVLAQKPEISLGKEMTDSILSILLIGGFVSIFFVVIEIFNQTQIFVVLSNFLGTIFGLESGVFLGIFNGLIEMTHGCLDLTSLNLPIECITVICTGIITFGGFATMLQAYAFLQKIGISFGFFMFQKITQTIFACVISLLLVLIL